MFPRLLPVLFAAVLVLSGCGDGGSDDNTQASGVAAANAWVKATDMNMSAAFMVVSNSAEEDATIVGVTTDLTDTAELHETADGTMRPVESLTVPAGGSLMLEPGGNHLMLMELTEAIDPGQEVTFTLEFDDGSTFDVTATAKDFAGGAEDYEGTEEH
ncbi:hypothetical protein AFL01nite_16860 [Aeromicrobium flavum]|uniref:Lipoprotein n=1 Tax=Aeromicrobium flavum TaxID=416568 RepID=A0A512HV80_9ACTN|nr:copper chaperone PCu(A)C [Aeromicrobium flavum]GEO89359.1 hypothetical protein AFL01nite_16860 [Aeromicrobium flavum]